MSRRKISELESATDITGSDLIQVVDVEDSEMAVSGTNKKATAQLLADELSKIASFKSTGTTATRFLVDRFADVINVKDFGAKGDGITNDRDAIQSAIDSSSSQSVVYLPSGTYKINSALFIKKSNTRITGDGVGVTKIFTGNDGNYAAIDVRTSLAAGNLYNITIENLTIDGNKANRPTAGGNGILLLCNTQNSITDTRILNVEIYNCRNAGILMEGRNFPAWPASVPSDDAYRVERTQVNGCVIFNNDGVGISQFKASNSKITECTLFNNGLENITIDIRSNGCIVDGNTFFKHLGGTGNIGVDTGDACVISNNFIDNENDTTASAGFRTGIALNSQIPALQGNTDTVITGNVILNCSDNGIYAHNDTGIGGDKAGSGIIVGNTFAGNGVDIRAEDGYGPLYVKSNKIQTINITDIQANDVRFGAGDICFNGTLSSDQTQAISVSTGTWYKVALDTNTGGRLTSISSNEIQLSAGGLYQINASLRFNGLTALDADYISIAIKHTPVGGSSTDLVVTNIDPNAGSFVSDVQEITTSVCSLLDKGNIGLYFRVFSANSGTVTIKSGNSSKLTGALIG